MLMRRLLSLSRRSASPETKKPGHPFGRRAEFSLGQEFPREERKPLASAGSAPANYLSR